MGTKISFFPAASQLHLHEAHLVSALSLSSVRCDLSGDAHYPVRCDPSPPGLLTPPVPLLALVGFDGFPQIPLRLALRWDLLLRLLTPT